MAGSRPLLQPWDDIRDDLESFFASKPARTGDVDDLEVMLRTAFPAICRRYCELGASLGTRQGTCSCSVMVCHRNEVRERILVTRVVESFPNYGLDRTLQLGNGYWELHLRCVPYGEISESTQLDVVSAAIRDRRRTYRRVTDATLTQSERQHGLAAVWTFVPSRIMNKETAFDAIPSGSVICANLDFYSEETAKEENAMLFAERIHVFEHFLDDVQELSLLLVADASKRQSAISALLSKGGRFMADVVMREFIREAVRRAWQ